MTERSEGGLSILDLRAFLGDADDLAIQLGVWAGTAVPLVVANQDGTIRHLWVGVQHRNLPRLMIARAAR
jgi:hypothetical protein